MSNKLTTKLKHDLITDKHNVVYYESKSSSGRPTPDEFDIKSTNSMGEEELLTRLKFRGDKDGITNEDLISIVITRLSQLQGTEYGTRDKAVAITKLEESLMWLNRERNKGLTI